MLALGRVVTERVMSREDFVLGIVTLKAETIPLHALVWYGVDRLVIAPLPCHVNPISYSK